MQDSFIVVKSDTLKFYDKPKSCESKSIVNSKVRIIAKCIIQQQKLVSSFFYFVCLATIKFHYSSYFKMVNDVEN